MKRLESLKNRGANPDVIHGLTRYEQMRQTSLYVSLAAGIKEKTLLLDTQARKMTSASDTLMSELFSPKPYTKEEKRLLSVPERFLTEEEVRDKKRITNPPKGNKIYLPSLEKVLYVPNGDISFAMIGVGTVAALVKCGAATVMLPIRRTKILVHENPGLAPLICHAVVASEIEWEMSQMAKLDLRL